MSQSEELYKNIISSMQDIIFTLDKKQRHTGVYGRWLETYGLKEEDFLGRTAEEIMGQEAAKVHMEANEKALAGEYVIYEWSMQKGDKMFYFQTSLAPLVDPQGNIYGLVGIGRDITAEKQTEILLQESEKLHRLIFENAPVGIFLFDSKGRITMCNERFMKIIGSSGEEILGLNLLNLPDKKVIAAVQQCLGGENGFYEGWYYPLTSEKVSYLRGIFAPIKEEDGSVSGGVCFIEDNTERKLQEQQLAKITKEYETVFQGTQDAMFLVEAVGKTTFRYLRNNRAHAEATGFTLEELKGKTPQELLGEELGARVAANYARCLQEGGPISYEETLPLPAGTKTWLTTLTPLVDDDGIYIVGSSQDITARKEAEEKIRYLSFHDRLTGVYNRHFLEEEMHRLNSSRRNLPIGLVMADLNGLKLVNDTYGHEKGDALLKKAAEILRNSCRREDILGRWGGDEFLLILPQTKEEEAEQITKRIKEKARGVQVEEVPLSFALGFAAKTNAEENLGDILNRAEENMYRQKLGESKSTRTALLRGLLKALQDRGYKPKEHLESMEKLALKLAESLALPETELNRLKLLVLLHDIGMISVPEEILNKKEALTEKEREIIKKHPETGYRIVRATEEFSHIAEEILSHHERWDGTGYPRGLKGKEIPLLARIMALVDAYAALISESPDRKALSEEEAAAELKKRAGSQFDPKLVEILTAILAGKDSKKEVSAESRQ